jgi:hypothetical protein
LVRLNDGRKKHGSLADDRRRARGRVVLDPVNASAQETLYEMSGGRFSAAVGDINGDGVVDMVRSMVQAPFRTRRQCDPQS